MGMWFKVLLGVSVIGALAFYKINMETERTNNEIVQERAEAKIEENDFNAEFSRGMADMADSKEEKEFHLKQASKSLAKNAAIEKEKEEAKARAKALRLKTERDLKEMEATMNSMEQELDSNNDSDFADLEKELN